MRLKIRIDPYAGFCSGVVNAIKLAEKQMNTGEQLYSLGEIVHNQAEVERLKQKGLKVININKFKQIKNAIVLIRAHGEPPYTYELGRKNNNILIDASCKVVLKLQEKIKKAYSEVENRGGQILIFGKREHPEVIGLNGYTNANAIIIEKKSDLNQVNFDMPIRLYAQTTSNIRDFRELVKEINKRIGKNVDFKFDESICKQVIGRELSMEKFAKANDVNIFIAGKNSSNASFLFNICKSNNKNSFFISQKTQINKSWFKDAKSVGISGATSTPRWQMEEVKTWIQEKICF